MSSRSAVMPENVVPLSRARLCSEGHIYNSALWNGTCPCGTEQGVMLKEVLDVEKGKASVRVTGTEAGKRGAS
jgi:hypothetical protein